jgi:hypothetical protein
MIKQISGRLMLLMAITNFSHSAFAQESQYKEEANRKYAVNVFIDCRFCDMNFIRQEIPYVNYVRDTREAEVYILETRQNAGNGGNQYTYVFKGSGNFGGLNDTLSFTTSPDQTNTLVRAERTEMLKMGLMRYVARTPLFSQIDINHNMDIETQEVIDKWNNWVFEISTEPRFESQETQKQLELRNSLNIRKITPDIKLEIEIDEFYNREKYIENANTDSASASTYITSATSMDNLFVKSFGEHWSVGFKWRLGSSTRENYSFSTEFLPSVEYDIYPYSESTHHQLRILYSAGYQYNYYQDTTIFNRIREGHYLQQLNIAYQIQKEWGSIDMLLTGSNFFHDFSMNRIELFSSVNVRIFKGLSLRINGGIAHINDQLNLKKGDISEAERLLQLREQATKYRVGGGIEIIYTFGSIYNNIVNPRFNSRRFRF